MPLASRNSLTYFITHHSSFSKGCKSRFRGFFVQSADGKPVPNARVFLQPGDGRAAVTTRTDDAGQYRFAKVKPGVYELRAQSGGAWTELERNVSVRRSEEVCVKLTLPEKAPLL